jgi:hypothetical protein
MLTVDEYPLGFNIIYDVRSDNRDELYEWTEKIQDLYPPWGYSTLVEWFEENDEVYHARVTRSQSCD